MRRQLIGARSPPSTSPMNVPLMAAAWLIPERHPPRSGRESVGQDGGRVRHQHGGADALEDPHDDEPDAGGGPVIQVTLSSREKNVKTAKPRL